MWSSTFVDEVGYLTYGTDAANMLFHVVNDRHRHKRSIIFTTNKSLTAWGRVLHDDDLAHAIIDRVLERGRLLPLDGPSMRTKHLGLDEPTSPEASHQLARPAEREVIRISGIEAPEFPEPTSFIIGARFNRWWKLPGYLWFLSTTCRCEALRRPPNTSMPQEPHAALWDDWGARMAATPPLPPIEPSTVARRLSARASSDKRRSVDDPARQH